MGVPFKQYLSGSKIYSCSNCRCHAADHDDIESRVRRCGPDFLLWTPWVNVTLGPKEERLLMTGLHTVADIFCINCQALLGWTYVQAFEEQQKYKEGKFILEKAMIHKDFS